MAIDLFGPASAPGATTTRPGEGRSFGTADTFFKDCTSPSVDDGTEFQAAFFNQMLANLRGLGRGNGQTAGAVDIVAQDNTDDYLLLKAVQHLIQRGQTNFATDTGSANHVIVALSPAPAELKSGLKVRFKKMNAANTGATDLQVNAFPAKALKRMSGVDVAGNDLPANAQLEAIYDGVTDTFVLSNYNGVPTVSNIPWSDAARFIGNGAVSAPSTARTVTPFTSFVDNTGAGNFSLSGGVCVINTTGTYFVAMTGAVYSVAGGDPLFSLSGGFLYVNGGWAYGPSGLQSNSGATFKEMHGGWSTLYDFSAGDQVWPCLYQCHVYGYTVAVGYGVTMTITKVR